MAKKAKTLAQTLAKLDRPPAAHNWSLCNFQRQSRTTTALVNLAMGFPKVSYFWATAVIQNVLADGLSDERAIQNLEGFCPPSQIDDNLEYLNAFLSYNSSRKLRGFRVFDEFSGQFLAGPDVKVPVKPTIILNDRGIFKPLFVVGWATNSLNYYQRRLLSTLYEDAIYSLTDLRDSPGEVLFFPKNGYGVRTVEQWNRDTYQLLSKEELREQVHRFIQARSDARPIIADRFEKRMEEKARKEATRREAPRDPPGKR
ncbi:MAG TPA: hypothetical protein VFZ91_04845 [Allosphingosinicella sp.]